MRKRECHKLLPNYIEYLSEGLYQEKLPAYLEVLGAISRTIESEVFIADFYKWEIYHPVTTKSDFIPEIFPELELLYNSITGQTTISEQLLRIERYHLLFIDYLERIAPDRRCDYSLIYNTEYDDKRYLTIKMTPIHLTPDGKVWLVMCSVVLSSYTNIMNPEIHVVGTSDYLRLNSANNTWERIQEVQLDDVEKRILYYSRIGCNVQDIASRLFLSVDSIKARKKRLFAKLNVRNITEATCLAYSRGLL